MEKRDPRIEARTAFERENVVNDLRLRIVYLLLEFVELSDQALRLFDYLRCRAVSAQQLVPARQLRANRTQLTNEKRQAADIVADGECRLELRRVIGGIERHTRIGKQSQLRLMLAAVNL